MIAAAPASRTRRIAATSLTPPATRTSPSTAAATEARVATPASPVACERTKRATPWPARSRARAVEVEGVDHRRSEPDEMLRDPVGAIGRRADARGHARPEHDPRAAAGDVDGRDDLHLGLRQAAGAAAPRSRRLRRWKLIGRS